MYNFSVFKYVINVPEDAAREIAIILLTSRPGCPHGSSFAVTADAPTGRRNIYLSGTSFRTLKTLDIIPSLYKVDEAGDGVQIT